eukprot:6178306-Pleurochrysis_carterae.AAC.6
MPSTSTNDSINAWPYCNCARCPSADSDKCEVEASRTSPSGFTVGEVVKDYYKRIEPPDAVILSRTAPFPELAVKPPQYA